MTWGDGPRLLAIHPEALEHPEPFRIRCDLHDDEEDELFEGVEGAARLARIEISGSLQGRVGFFDRFFGGATSYDQIQEAIAAADASKADTTLLVIDSGGGEAVGMGQASAALRNAKNRTAVFAKRAFSAAYGLAAGADTVAMARDGRVGSLSAFVLQEDSSRAAKKAGFEIIVSSPDSLKGSAVPGAKITPEQVAAALEMAVEAKADFADTIASGPRGLSLEDLEPLMKAQDFTATEALEAGLVDAIHDTEAQFVASLFTPTEDAEMADNDKGAGKGPEPKSGAAPPAQAPQAAAPPAAVPDPRIEAMLQGIAGLKGTVETLASTVEGLALTVAQSADDKLRARLEAAKATDIDHELAVCKALTPELREAHVAKLEKDGRDRAAFDGLGELLDTRLDVPTPGGESVSVPADGGLDLAPGSFDLTDAACNTQAIAVADKVNPDHKSTEWKAAHRTEYVRLTELAAGVTS